MSNIIKLLPDNIANQIAAGEVIQRPASVVKELLENAIDSGASEIKMLIKDGGRTSIQIIDNGCGMSWEDSRNCFERHATSKISSADDLFRINTKGFRGEALATIASIAQVELKTKQIENETGSYVKNEGCKITSHEECICADGTNITVKNLFYNVPARRKFLKADHIELKHINEEFYRLALAHYNISFELLINDKPSIIFPESSKKERIVQVLGKNSEKKLVPIDLDTNIVNISGYVGIPEASRKTKGEQYFFVNNRYFKSSYFHHSVTQAFADLIPEKNSPIYIIFLEVDTNNIDINIHPTKTEINFSDRQPIYSMLKATVKKSLGQFDLMPSIDFEQENSMIPPPMPKDYVYKTPSIDINPNYNPFTNPKGISDDNEEVELSDISQEEYADNELDLSTATIQSSMNNDDEPVLTNHDFFIIDKQYIAYNLKTSILLIDIDAAKELIIYKESNKENISESQKLLFPEQIDIPHQDIMLFEAILPNLKTFGFDIDNFGQNSFVVHGIPANISNNDIQQTIENLIEAFNNEYSINVEDDAKNTFISKFLSINNNNTNKELLDIVEQLYKYPNIDISPSGKKIKHIIKLEDINDYFKK